MLKNNYKKIFMSQIWKIYVLFVLLSPGDTPGMGPADRRAHGRTWHAMCNAHIETHPWLVKPVTVTTKQACSLLFV